ncbi:cytochrome P450 6j1-like [Xylocopa sonorina]|uniref:cytochrome P450 6j1-like n=1 Tax=Xylocopa sonorina TaxID=1818115 RepID=UPI00403B001D
MTSPLLTLAVGAFLLLCFYLYIKYTYWKRNGIPTAKGCYPFVGHMLSILVGKVNYAEMITEIYDEHKDRSVVGFYKAMKPTLIVRDPNLVKTVLQSNFPSFSDNGNKIQPDADPLLAKNPFFNSGEDWRVGRKRLTYAFSNVRLRILFMTVSEVCKKFTNFLDKRLRSTNKCEIELKYLFSKFTGEVVANAGLGIEGLCFEDKVHPTAFDQIGHTMFEPSLLVGFINQLIILFPEINRLFKLGFVPKKVDKYFRRIVTENLEIRRKETTPRNDFIQLMIDLEKSGETLDIEAIAAHALSFYIDGYETSSITLSFIGYQLATHPDVQEKLRSEVKSTVEKHGNELTFEALKEMTYMDNVINESQRCYPALGFMSKLCTEEIELQGSDGLRLRVKPGTEITIPVFGLHRDAKYWPDPDNFDPNRFDNERKQTIEKMAFLPFGEGPRMCVGMKMALLQMKACLATLMLNYKLELSPKTQLPLRISPSSFLSIAKGGLWAYISRL